MGQLLHGSAKTTHAVRAELQRSQAPVAQLAKRYGIHEKTVIKWRSRPSVEDMPVGPQERRRHVLSPLEEAATLAGSEEGLVGKGVAVRVDLGGSRVIKKKKK